MGQLRSIQVLRGLAACGVVLLHVHSFGAGSRVTLGTAGVDLFFVISGFIMASIAKRPLFLFDRFWRIYPLWWIALIPWLSPLQDWRTLFSSITLWPMVDGRMTAPALSVGWTLSFEMLFYCAVALSLRTGVKPLLGIFAVMLAGAVLTRAPIFSFLGNPMIFEFLLGAAIARLPKDARFSLPLLVFAVAAFAFAPTWVYAPEFAMRAPASAWRVLYWGVPSALIVYACLSAERFFVGRWWNIPVLLGNASYSIYLFHLTVIKGVSLPWPIEMSLAISVGVLTWWFLEQPILRLKRLVIMLDRSRNGVAGRSGEISLEPALVRTEVDERVGL